MSDCGCSGPPSLAPPSRNWKFLNIQAIPKMPVVNGIARVQVPDLLVLLRCLPILMAPLPFNICGPEPCKQITMTGKGLIEAQIFVVKKQQLIGSRQNNHSCGKCHMATDGKVYLSDRFRIEDAEFHHLVPRHASGCHFAQVCCYRRKRFTDHLEAKRGENSNAFTLTSLEIRNHIRVPEKFIDVRHDHPI